jgi:hypothetical protein
MARAILLFLAKRLGLARVSTFETRPATSVQKMLNNEIISVFNNKNKNKRCIAMVDKYPTLKASKLFKSRNFVKIDKLKQCSTCKVDTQILSERKSIKVL